MKLQVPLYRELFPITPATEYGREIAESMWTRQDFEGGMACLPEDAGILAQCVFNSGNGDYLELGTLFGGTAVLAALVKKKYGLGGKVVCIDDLAMLDRTPDVIHSNAALFGVTLDLHVGKTYPYPLGKQRFSCIYIDASHDFENCYRDWLSVKGVADKYVVFHDYDADHGGVMAVVKRAEFYPVHIARHTAVLEWMP